MSREVTEPRVTGNSALLAGYVIGLLMAKQNDFYRVAECETSTGVITLESIPEGNRFTLTVRQTGGPE